ncbi:MAG: ribosome recycling factor [Legionellales bacterium]|nr:ribosome recycling factor [Legionellales bacterium]|tara:strand:- start:118 stop:672 length:555 start_codon:yes stop_codon:yes gene_type:complete
MNEVMSQATLQMQKTLEATEVSLSKIRTGRAHPSLIESIKVNVYGSDMPLSQVASITAEDARTLAVSVWDKSQISAVEKAIMSSDLGLNPVVNGQLMRIPMPPLTQERRLDFIKLVKSEGESSKVSIRNARRDALDTLKNLKKDKALSEDEERQGQVEVQKLTDQFIQKIEAMISEKEADLRSL